VGRLRVGGGHGAGLPNTRAVRENNACADRAVTGLQQSTEVGSLSDQPNAVAKFIAQNAGNCSETWGLSNCSCSSLLAFTAGCNVFQQRALLLGQSACVVSF
jgi:hypothetical protein